MKILNVREGFACNSSSTHSIIFTNTNPSDDDVNDGFQWNYFTAASREAKMAWLATQLYLNMKTLKMGDETTKLVMKSLTGHSSNEGLDHQSQIKFPQSWSGAGLDLAFVTEFRDYLLDPRAVIFGGNDNGDGSEPTGPEGHVVYYRNILPVDTSNSHVVARKDETGYWTIFDRTQGNKTRVSFGKEDFEVSAMRASAPELVDMKLTDYCTYDCPTCYQGSTRQGKHGSEQVINSTLRALAEMHCFEIAFGGGEPTFHPEFSNIIRYTKELGMVPNFTTRDPKWFNRHPDAVEHLGAYAVSCDGADDVRKAKGAIDALAQRERFILENKLTVQHILGSVNEYELKSLLATCRSLDVPVVLLGYKTTHRGASGTPKVPKNKNMTWGTWLKNEIEHDGDDLPYRLGVDTVLAAELSQYEDLEYRLTTKEGQFSGYIDTVGEKPRMWASSFSVGDGISFEPNKKGALAAAWKDITAYTPESSYVYKRSLATA